MRFIEIRDFILLPVYLAIIYLVAINSRNRKYRPNHPLRRFYIPALTVKIFGAIALGIVYQYYYGIGGDTAKYFWNGRIVSEIFRSNLSEYFQLIFKPISSTLEIRDQINWTDADFGYDESNYFPVRVLGVLQLFTFQTYLPSAVLFAYISFIGIWKAYTAFVHIFPALYKEFAIAFLFMPSVFFWGSGILKDTLVIAALGWLFYGCYTFFILRVNLIRGSFIVTASTITLMIIKAYVALAFLPSLLFFIFFQYRSRIASHFLRVIALPVVMIIIVFGGLFLIQLIGEQSTKYSTENLLSQASSFNANNMDAGSSVNLGVSADMEPSQILKLAPLAIATTLFRPFIFEVRNPLMLLSSLEGSYIIYLFLTVLFKTGIVKSFQIILQNPVVAFCLVFSLIFAFAVGFATSNFGTLVRYKIPCIPYFMAALYFIRGQFQISVYRNRITKQA